MIKNPTRPSDFNKFFTKYDKPYSIRFLSYEKFQLHRDPGLTKSPTQTQCKMDLNVLDILKIVSYTLPHT